MTEPTEPIVSTLRVRIGQEEAHYGGNLVEGARVLKLFGDIVTEIAIITDGDEGCSSATTGSSSWPRSTPATSSRSPGPSPGSAAPAGRCGWRRAR
jgi:hypothetical protein